MYRSSYPYKEFNMISVLISENWFSYYSLSLKDVLLLCGCLLLCSCLPLYPSLSPGPGYVLVRRSIILFTESLTRGPGHVIYIWWWYDDMMIWRWWPGGHIFLITESLTKGPGHEFVYIMMLWLWIPSPLLKGRDTNLFMFMMLWL